MAWIKRNLFFLIGSLIAVGLIVAGVIYLLGQINDESQVTEDIQKQYAELKRLADQKPHPGNDKIDNIKTAREQEAVLRDYIKKERALFQPITPIPDLPADKPGNAGFAREFARELRNTVAEMRRSADQQSVKLPSPDYYFTFKGQEGSVTFDSGSLGQLASHLGEIKALTDILFAAKINFLDSIQREIISSNQDNNTSDFLSTRKTVSTPLADITPYQVSFRCFSADLAQVLVGLATSPNGFMVQSINVEPASPVGEEVGNPFGNPNMIPPPQQLTQQPYIDPRLRRPGFPPPQVVNPATPAPGTRAGTVEFLKEKAFRVTLLVQVVKPKPEVKAK